MGAPCTMLPSARRAGALSIGPSHREQTQVATVLGMGREPAMGSAAEDGEMLAGTRYRQYWLVTWYLILSQLLKTRRLRLFLLEKI